MKLIKTLFLIAFLSSYSQKKTEEERFLDYFIKKELQPKVRYTDKIKPDYIEYIIEEFNLRNEQFRDLSINYRNLPEKIVFTKNEVEQTVNEILISNENGWIKNKLPKMNYVSYEELVSNKKIINYFSFSKPIFLRNNSICIFYVDNLNGGALNVYYKVNQNWNYFSNIFDWSR